MEDIQAARSCLLKKNNNKNNKNTITNKQKVLYEKQL